MSILLKINHDSISHCGTKIPVNAIQWLMLVKCRGSVVDAGPPLIINKHSAMYSGGGDANVESCRSGLQHRGGQPKDRGQNLQGNAIKHSPVLAPEDRRQCKWQYTGCLCRAAPDGSSVLPQFLPRAQCKLRFFVLFARHNKRTERNYWARILVYCRYCRTSYDIS